MQVLALQGALVGQGHQEKMGFLGLLVIPDTQESPEFVDSLGEMVNQGFQVSTRSETYMLMANPSMPVTAR